MPTLCSSCWRAGRPRSQDDERSRNVIDTQGDLELSRTRGTEQRDLEPHPVFASKEQLQAEKYRLQRLGEKNPVRGRNVQVYERRTGLCGELQAARLRKRGRL